MHTYKNINDTDYKKAQLIVGNICINNEYI